MPSEGRHERYVDEDLDWLVELSPEEKDWDESKHPREPSGGPGGGEFTSGGGGGGEGGDEISVLPDPGASINEAKVSTGEKVKSLSDFSKDDVGVYYQTSEDAGATKTFVDTWNSYVDKTPADFRKEFFGGDKVNGALTVSLGTYEADDAIKVASVLKDENGKSYGQMDATIFPSEDRVHMDYYLLKDTDQAHGVMKDVMAHEMQMWQDMGVTKVDLYANINVGGYAWARYGFVPTQEAWNELSGDIEFGIKRLSSGDSIDGSAESWDDISVPNQNRIENSWMHDTHAEFVDSEINSWHESGTALEQAKNAIVDDFNDNTSRAWVNEIVRSYVNDRADTSSPVPFTQSNIVDAIGLNFKSKYDDGRGDVDVTFDDSKLNPTGTDTDPTLPGTPAVEPHEYLTDSMRDDITKLIQRSFDTTAEHDANNLDPPGYITDQATEYQHEYWQGMDDSERYQWAENHRSDLVKGSDSVTEGSGEMSDDEAKTMMKLAGSSDPRALWQIADSKWGKELLLRKNWNGEFDMNNKDQMGRFKSYVETAAKKKA